MPVGPGVCATRRGTPTVVAAAGAPGITGVEVLAIITCDPRRERDSRADVAAVTGADIQNRMQEVAGVRFHIRRPVVRPSGIATFTTTNTGEHFEVKGRINRFAVRSDLAASDSPEVAHLRARASGFRMSGNDMRRTSNQPLCCC